MGSGKGWTPEESVAACRAYVAASEDPISGSGKKKEFFKKQVLAAYSRLMDTVKQRHGNVEYNDRSGEAIVQRHRKARCESIKFEGIIGTIKRKNPTSSPSEEDIIRAATAVYNKEANVSNMYTYFRDATVDYGPEFPFKDCLLFFRTTQSWSLLLGSQDQTATLSQVEGIANAEEEVMAQRNQSPSSTDRVSSQSNTVGAVVLSESRPENGRPIGSKRSQELSKKVSALKRGADGIEKLAEASQKRTKVAQDLLQIERQQYMMRLFSMPGTDPNLSERFMRNSQLKALKEMENGKAASPTEFTNNPDISLVGNDNAASDSQHDDVIPVPESNPSHGLSSILN